MRATRQKTATVLFRFTFALSVPLSHTALESIMAQVNPIRIQKFLKGVDYPATKAARH